MTAEQKRLVLAVCVTVGISFVIGASLNFMLTPMLADLGLTKDQAGTALAIPSIASLLIVFATGRAGDRVGHRRVIVWASLPFVVGSVLVGSAPAMPMISLGLLLAGASATAMQIVSLGLLQQAFPAGPSRVSAFTSFGMVFPAVYLVVPVLTGWLVGVAPWRVVPVLWALLGLAIPVVVLRLIPPPGPAVAPGELWTPILAGVVLAGVVEMIDAGHDHGWTSPGALTWLLVSLLAAAACAWLLRSMREPSLSLRALGNPTMALLLACVAMVAMTNTLTYVMLGLEYLYGESVLVAALWLVPAQAAAVVGAKFVAQQLMDRWGAARAGRIMLAGLALTLLPLVLMSATAPLALLVVTSALFSLFGFGSITIVNAVVMAQSPPGEAGMVSAYRGGASSLGTALGVVILGAAVSGVVLMASTTAVGTLPDPAALADGLRANGLMGALIAAVAWVAFSWAVRDRSNRDGAPARVAT
ncbi:MAG: MFS transporter [Candidatus Nanopelagicales bacterium]